MLDEEYERALIALGLEPVEAQVYLEMVRKGPRTVGLLAPATGLSRTKAYSVLDGMVARGTAVLVTHRPRTYTAVDPRALLQRRMEALGSAKQTIEEGLVPLYREQEDRGNVSLMGTAVLQRTEEMLQRARRDIVFVAGFVPKEAVARMTGLIDEVRERGVRVRTVVSDALVDSTLLARLRAVTELRVRRTPNAGMLIVDDEEVLIGTNAEGGSDIKGLWSRDRELIKLQRMLFEDIYERGVA